MSKLKSYSMLIEVEVTDLPTKLMRIISPVDYDFYFVHEYEVGGELVDSYSNYEERIIDYKQGA